MILFTPNTRPELLQAVDDLIFRNLYPVVAPLNAQTFGGPAGTESLINSLRERRMPVCVVACDDNLSVILSNIAPTFKSQDMRSWQIPVLSH